MKKKSDGYNVAARLSVFDIPSMTDKGRKQICNWLRQKADEIQGYPKAYNKIYCARYLYREASKAWKS